METGGCHTRGKDWVAAGAAATSPEAHLAYLSVPYDVLQGRWTNPMTNRIMLEAGGTYLNTNYGTAYASTYLYSPGNAAAGGTRANPTAIYTPRFARLDFTVNF